MKENPTPPGKTVINGPLYLPNLHFLGREEPSSDRKTIPHLQSLFRSQTYGRVVTHSHNEIEEGGVRFLNT